VRKYFASSLTSSRSTSKKNSESNVEEIMLDKENSIQHKSIIEKSNIGMKNLSRKAVSELILAISVCHNVTPTYEDGKKGY